MIGDMIISLKKFLKQTFCLHKYRTYSREVGIHIITFCECEKCGRSKTFLD